MRNLIPRAVAAAAAMAALAIPAAAAARTAPPVLSWAPATYSYGTPAAGQTVAKTFTLTNAGGSATSVLKITLTGSPAFTKTGDTCTGTSLGPGKTCTVTLAFTAPAVPGQAVTATLTATSNKPAATATAALSGASAQAAPTLATTPGSGGTPGSTVTDTATLTGGYHPTGTIEFQLYPTADCSGPPADDETVTVAGNGTYTTPDGAALTQPGTYYWTARYSGDAANSDAVSGCGAEQVAISKAAPTITTISSSGTVGSAVTDTATISGGDQPTGTIEFQLYPTADCSGPPADDETVTVAGNGTYTTPTGYTPAQVGTTYSWIASYSGDANNTPAATSCGTDTVTIAKAAPALTDNASGGCGPECSTWPPTADAATLSGGDNPTGTIEFRLYGFNAGCSGAPIDDVTVTVDGDGSYATPNPYMPSFGGDDEGEFCWTATYSGDANNAPATAFGGVFYQIGLPDD